MELGMDLKLRSWSWNWIWNLRSWSWSWYSGVDPNPVWLSAGMSLDKLIMNNFPSLNGKIEIRDSQCNLRCKEIKIFWGAWQHFKNAK